MGCLRAPQRRHYNEDSVDKPSPPARLFVTRSPADSEKITGSREKVYSTLSVVHGWFGLVRRCLMPFASQIMSKRIWREKAVFRLRGWSANRMQLSVRIVWIL